MVRHHRRSRKEDRSFAGEYAHLNQLAEKLGIEAGYVVDIGASDGVNQSCTLGFFKRPDWSGLAVEVRPEQFGQMAFVYTEFSNTQLAMNRVTPTNVRSLLQAHEVPERFSILNIDIDSYDLPVAEALLKGGYRPTIITLEINESIPPPVFFTVDYHEDVEYGNGAFNGCSLVAAAEVIRPFGYKLESLQYNNAMFVLTSECNEVIEDKDIVAAYDEGFRDKPDRAELFSWHEDIDQILNAEPEEVINILSQRFVGFEGKYTLKITR